MVALEGPWLPFFTIVALFESGQPWCFGVSQTRTQATDRGARLRSTPLCGRNAALGEGPLHFPISRHAAVAQW
jgi:hypothetical protein